MIYRSIPLVVAMTLILAGCGNSTANNLSSLQATLITGTAATAAGPLANVTITLKDSSLINAVTTTTDSQGHYSFTVAQVQGFTSPLMEEASYTVGGADLYLHSAVVTSDYATNAATINITPLTETVLANILGISPRVAFRTGTFTGITAAELTSSVQSLDAVLQPLFPATGLSGTPDLLHQSFTVNNTGLDALVNAVQVNIDPVSKSEIITNALNGSSISGALDSPPTTPISATGMASTSNQQAIMTVLNTVATQLANSPTTTTPALLASFDQTNFLNNGESLTTYLQDVINRNQTSGGSLAFTDPVLSTVPSYVTLPSGATNAYSVSFTTIQNTKQTGRSSYVVYQNASGAWLILGNQLHAKVVLKTFEGDNNGTLCSGLQLNITDEGAFSNGGTTLPISYATITGPGLPSTGEIYYQNGTSNTLALAAEGTSYAGTSTTPATSCYQNIYAMTDAQIGEIDVTNLPAVYTVTLYNVTGSTTTTLASYQPQIMVPPLTSAQLISNIFPTGITVSPALSTAAATGSPITVNWSNPTLDSEVTTTATTTTSTAATQGSFSLLPDSVYVWAKGTAGGGYTIQNIPLTSAFTVPLTSQISTTTPATTSPSSGGVTLSYLDSIFLTIWASPASGF